MPTIEQLTAIEILDSRGRPTVRCSCRLVGGAEAAVSVPSGASTGDAEAHELRDGDIARYNGLGCRKAVANIVGELSDILSERHFACDAASQRELDCLMASLNESEDKSRLGANAILAVSLAFARAVSLERRVPLYRHFADISGASAVSMPRLTINLFSGGKHAGGQVPIQDVLIAPLRARTIDESLVMAAAVYQAAAKLIWRKYGMRLLRADEGGLAPPARDAEALIQDAVDAICDAGFEPGRDMSIAVDVAASHFYIDGSYHLGSAILDGAEMIRYLSGWVRKYPIVSIEDGLAQSDWEHWPLLQQAIGQDALVLGDDFLCTNPARIRRAIQTGAANSLLLKVNQIGTLSEAAEAHRLATDAGWSVTASARSGETEDDWLADLAVGWSCRHIKIGSITQSERLAKYNRLLVIEAEAGAAFQE